MLCDIHCRTVKCFEPSIFKNRNTNAANVPHLPVWSNNPVSYVTATALFMHCPDGFRNRGSVLRVDGGQILFEVRGPVLRVKAETLVYLVRPIDTQIVRPANAQILCRPAPHMSEALPFAQVKLALPQVFLRSLALSDVLGGTEHLIGSSRRVFLQITQAVYDPHFSAGTKKPVFTVSACSRMNGLFRCSKYCLSIVSVDHFP